MTLQDGVDHFIDKEDEYTPLPILTSISCGLIVTEDNITTIRREGIVVNYDNHPDQEDFSLQRRPV